MRSLVQRNYKYIPNPLVTAPTCKPGRLFFAETVHETHVEVDVLER